MDSITMQGVSSPINANIGVPSGGAPRPFPRDAKLINLRENSKAPASAHGHHDAVTQEEFVQTGTNVGIVLDGMYLLLDIDKPDNEEARLLSERARACNPWEQKTPKGTHFLFRTQPEWGGHNTTLRDKNGTVFGDIKALGYAVGPGSVVNETTYQVVNASDPPPAPHWLLEKAAIPPRAETKVEERDGIPYGEHDAFLVRLAGYLRGREGLTENAIRGVLEAGPLGVLASYDETRPYTPRDLARVAHSAIRWEPKQSGNIDLVHPSLRSAADIELVGPTIEWVVRGFVPRGELVLMYGPGGIGKSSAGSWLAAEVNRLGWTFCYMGTEEPPARFFGRAVLAGANRGMCFDVQNPSSLKFPRDANIIRGFIQESKVDFLYIDSIYTHFERKEGDNAAERARDALAPLLAIAHETGCTIFGVFHTNKAGAFLGSTEMENVARCLLEAKRKPKQTYLGIKVHKTNLYHPGKMMRLEGREEIFRDEQGNVQLERDENGNEIPLTIIVPSRIDDVEDVEDPEEDAPLEYDQGDVELPRKERVRRLLEEHPEYTNAQMAEELSDIPLGTIKRISWELRE